ncbi:alpha/beta fold hydrolase [Trueperella sp. LYQ141]|uniref:alpha/beta fold hydrolase n=1 Tax=Trueperella sp. LYQ141 TaxID=3391058 RepID=UPI0039833E8E
MTTDSHRPAALHFLPEQHTLAHIAGISIRIHRFNALAAGLNRRQQDTPGDGRVTFVLIHGIGMSSRYMKPLARTLAEYGEVLLLDMPGSAGLPAPQRARSIAGFAAIVDAALALNGITDPILIGHSMGAQIATELLARRPQKYRRACLIGPPVNAAERHLPIAFARYLQSGIYEKGNLMAVAALAYMRCAKDWFFTTLPIMLRYPIENRISLAEHADIIFLRGQHDYLAPPSWIKTLQQNLPQSQSVTILGAAHSTLYNDDDDVAQCAISLMQPDELARLAQHRNTK